MNHIFEGCYINEGIPSGSYLAVDIFVKVPIIFEGIPGGDNYSDGNKEDCDHTKDQGVEAKKMLHRWQGQAHSS